MKSGLVLEGMTPPWEQLRPRLAGSKFRSRFKLADADRAYVARTGWETLRSQAEKIVRERLAPAAPGNDGRQTPKRGHPVFIAQHATATCVPPLPEPLKPSVPSLRVSGKEGNREASPRTGPESETRPSTARARAAPSS